MNFWSWNDMGSKVVLFTMDKVGAPNSDSVPNADNF